MAFMGLVISNAPMGEGEVEDVLHFWGPYQLRVIDKRLGNFPGRDFVLEEDFIDGAVAPIGGSFLDMEVIFFEGARDIIDAVADFVECGGEGMFLIWA